MAICSITVVPVGTGSTSVSPYVARCHEVLEGFEGIKYQLTPMATILEGDLDILLRAVSALHGVPFEKGAHRAYTVVTIDERRDKDITMAGKVASVEKKLGR
jgi:uncharacterized protein (TIGR00106 family)